MIKKNDVVYISGPMSGVEDFNFPAFHNMEEHLHKNYKCIVLNPANHPQRLNYDQLMIIDLAMVEACDVLVLMDGWHTSPGAQKERAHAVNLGKRIFRSSHTKIYYSTKEIKLN